jgi:hypothetical protein
LFRMPIRGKTVIPCIILFGRLWRGRRWRPVVHRRVRAFRSCRRAPIFTVERGESPGCHPLPCPPPTPAPSPLSSSSYPPQNPSRRPAATGLLGSCAGDAEHTAASSVSPRPDPTRSAAGAAPMRCGGCDQGLLIYASPTLSAAAATTRGSWPCRRRLR